MTAFLQTMNVDEGMVGHYFRLKARAAQRDTRMNLIREVRQGNMRQMFPDHLSEILGERGVAVANWVDVVARDQAEVLAPLPALACAAGAMRTDADKKRAERKNRIGDWYWRESKLDIQMLWGADWYSTYGFLPFYLEPDFDIKCPVIQLDDPHGAYYEQDRFFNVTTYAKTWWRTVDELAAQFPEYAGRLLPKSKSDGSPGQNWLELVRWVDDTHITLFVPARDGLILARYAHGFGRPPVWIAGRPGISMESTRGQFDDVVFVQLARAIIAGLGLEAAEKSVGAPIALPADVQELPVGPDAIIQTSQPQNVRRVSLDLPPAAFQESQQLYNELTVGSRYPDARMGQVNASVITGRGVQAMMGTFDSQLKASQLVFAHGLRQITSMAFEMDQKLFPTTSKRVRGTLSGRSYELTYVPERDIAGNFECDVTYGFAAGMAPSQSMVTMLQLRGDSIISRSTFRQNMPIDIDDEQEQRVVDVEALRDSLKQGLFQLVQSVGPMVEQGQDPTQILQAAASVVQAREDGVPLEDALKAAFTEMQQAREAQQQAQQQAAMSAMASQGGPGGPGGPPGAPGGGDAAGGPLDQGGSAMSGLAPGQAGGAGGYPPIQHMIAGMRGNGDKAVLQDTVERRMPLGA